MDERQETRNERFKRLANARMNKCLKQLQLIENLSNRSNYDWSEEEAKKIVATLKQSVASIEMKFKQNEDTKRTFKL